MKNLFFNVPARRNFLKSDSVEMTHIEEEFYRVALIHHDLSFTLYHNGKLIFQLNGSNFKQRIISVFGNHFKDKLFPVEQETDFMKISGFIAKPENAKKKKSEQYMFINHRYVRHNLLNFAIETAYSELIPQGYKPAYFIDIEIDPSAIDINVSPTKVEVKLQDEKFMFGFLNAAVKKSLGTMSLTPRLDFDVEAALDVTDKPANYEVTPPSLHINTNYNPFDTVPNKSPNTGGFSQRESWKDRPSMGGWEDFLKGLKTEVVDNPEGEQLEAEMPSEVVANDVHVADELPEDLPFIMIDNRRFVTKINNQTMIVDIVNARERILYDQYLSALQNTPIRVQQSLFPVTITLTPAQADLADTLKSDFLKLGYELEKMDNTHFAVNGTPNNEDEDGDLQAIIEKALDAFKTNQFLYKADSERNMAISMARQNRSRYKPLRETSEVRALMQQLLRCTCPTMTPSQKRVMHVLTDEELCGCFE